MINHKELYQNLLKEVDNGNVSVKEDGPYRLFCYTKQCVMAKNWNDTTLYARGIVFDSNTMTVAASCMPKFFNLFENGVGIDDLPMCPFVCYEKLDGSLIHVWYDFYQNRWRATSKGSFNSDQAQWAQKYIDKYFPPLNPNPYITYVFEAIYPENKIVIDYKGISKLFVLTVIDNRDFIEYTLDPLRPLFDSNYFPLCNMEYFRSISDCIDAVAKFDKNKEGFVIRYENGLRIKIKGKEYLRIHKALSNFTPLSIYEVLCTCESIDSCRNKLRLDLPEEFWDELDNMLRIYEYNINCRKQRFNYITSLDIYKQLKTSGSRKDFALYINKYIERQDDRALYFMDLDNKTINIKDWLKPFRPVGNKLDGYQKTISNLDTE